MPDYVSILITAIAIPIAIEVYRWVKKFEFSKRRRLNNSLRETIDNKNLRLLEKITPFFSKSIKAKHWADKNNENIVIIERFGKRPPNIDITGICLKLDIPNEYEEIIQSYYSDFDNSELENDMEVEVNEILKDEYYIYYNGSKEVNDEVIEGILTRHKRKVADTFVKRLKTSKICFNNEMYGLLDYKKGKKLTLRFYKTDFFTFQVFQSIFDELSSNPRCPINRIDNKEKLLYYRVFLCAFGVNTFLVTDNSYYSEILFAKRSKYNIGSNIYKNRYHYSMNEAFSKTDNADGKLDNELTECIRRGLKEELGIPSEIKAKKTVLMDFVFSKKLMQVGISSVCYYDSFNSVDIKNCYNGAKDGRLETDDLVFVPYKKGKIKPLIYNNSIPKINSPKYMHSRHLDSLTDESRMGLFQLFTRYPKARLLRKTTSQNFKRDTGDK